VGLLVQHYSLSVVGSDVVAGRPVDVIAARRPAAAAGDHDVARFWLDRSSGLVLRREVYDRRGRTTRASAFVEVTVGEATVSGDAAGAAWTATLDRASVARLRRHGWHCPATLPGPLTLVDARRGGEQDIVHLSYSDGIATVSVFEQRGRLDEDGMAGHHRQAADGQSVWVRGEVPRRVVWSADGTVYTVVADAPERTVDAVVAALPHSAADDGPLGRLGRGLDRVASWFNPFA
jgi:sigma-E factor negative regulatory protein RseB